MPTQEEHLAIISGAALAQTQAVIELKARLTQLVTDATNQFNTTIARVNSLNKVDNIADLDKAISFLTQSEINKKQDVLKSGENISTINGVSLLTGEPLVVERSATSLHRLNYSDALSLKTPAIPLPITDDSVIIEGLGLFMFTSLVNEPEDKETCFTSLHPTTGLPIGQWLLTIPAYEWTMANSQLQRSVISEYIADKK